MTKSNAKGWDRAVRSNTNIKLNNTNNREGATVGEDTECKNLAEVDNRKNKPFTITGKV